MVYNVDYSTGNKVFGKFGSVRVFLEPTDFPLDSQWGRSWPEGIKLDDNFQSSLSLPRSYYNREGTLLSSSNPSRKIAPVKRTYDWQAEELVISFNMTGLTYPTCSRLEPPVTWLAASGAKVKVSHSGACSEDDKLKANELEKNERNPKKSKSKKDSGPLACSSVIEVAVSRGFAENSLASLRNKGFSREDIFRMLDKGPWVLAFDITSALSPLFDSLKNDLGLSQSQAVHIISHCPYLIAQYAHYKGRDLFATAKALLDVGYTMPRLVSDIMRFPSMLAAPPDRVRGWRSLLEGFGIAKDPALFGKMLKRAPFMYYLNPPKVGDEDLSGVVDSNASTTASAFVTYGALKVLEILSSQNFPDLDKIIRTQPSILLVDVNEVSARATFLYDLFAEAKGGGTPMVDALSLPSYSGKNKNGEYVYGHIESKGLASEGPGSETKIEKALEALSESELRISQKWSSDLYGRSDVNELSFQYTGEALSENEIRVSQNWASDLYGRSDVSENSFVYNSFNSSGLSDSTGNSYSSSSNRRYIKKKTKLRGLSQNSTYDISDMNDENDAYVSSWFGEYTPATEDNVLEAGMIIELEEEDEEIIAILEEEEKTRKERIRKSESDNLNKHGVAAHELLGSLLLTYPAVLSIDHQQMRAAGNALRSMGLRRGEVILIARRHPPVLGRDSKLLIGLMSFLKNNCGLSKAQLLPFLFVYPAVLGADVRDIEPKVDYLFQSLGGSQDMLRRCPSFLSFDLEGHTRPRAEFLRALKIDPLINGLAFLVNAPAKEIAYTAGVRVELFNQFQTAYAEMWRKKAAQEKREKIELENAKSISVERNDKTVKDQTPWLPQTNNSLEESFFDEMDFSF